jgi:hypothetical protein
MRKDAAMSGMETVEVVTPTIRGPSAAELRRPYERSLGEIAREWKQEHQDAVRKFKGGK